MTRVPTIKPTDANKARIVKTYGLPLMVVESLCGPEVFVASSDGRLLLSVGPLEHSPTREQYMESLKVSRLIADAVNEKYLAEGGYEAGIGTGPTPYGRRDEVWEAKMRREASRRGKDLIEVRFDAE